MSKGQVVYSARPEELAANDEIKAGLVGICRGSAPYPCVGFAP
jgi:hypothetical protein